MNIPILYSFRRCPYAMRARLALKYAGIQLELREIDLNKPPAVLLALSDSATVPVLHLPDGNVIDESWEIVQWAVRQNDPDLWLGNDEQYLIESDMLVETNDYSFKQDLDHYKYADRYPEQPMEHYRELGEEFLQELEDRLNETRFLLAETISIADIGVFPFVRQFAMVDQQWFDQAPYVKLQKWLSYFIESDGTEARLFSSVMNKYDNWKQGDSGIHL